VNIARIKDQTGDWERRIKITPKHDGFSIILRLRDMDSPTKKTVYLEHLFIDTSGKVVHHHTKYPPL